jgi:antitoxin FitA
VAQLIVRNLEDGVKQKLKRRAQRHGRSMEDEARDILRSAVKDEGATEPGLGSRLKARFAGLGLKSTEISEVRGTKPRPAKFGAKS